MFINSHVGNAEAKVSADIVLEDGGVIRNAAEDELREYLLCRGIIEGVAGAAAAAVIIVIIVVVRITGHGARESQDKNYEEHTNREIAVHVNLLTAHDRKGGFR